MFRVYRLSESTGEIPGRKRTHMHTHTLLTLKETICLLMDDNFS